MILTVLRTLVSLTLLFSFAHQPLTLWLVYGDAAQRRSHASAVVWAPVVLVLAIAVGTSVRPEVVALVAGVWNVAHTLRQRYGLCKLYGRLSGVDCGADNRLLWSWLTLAVIVAFARTDVSRHRPGGGHRAPKHHGVRRGRVGRHRDRRPASSRARRRDRHDGSMGSPRAPSVDAQLPASLLPRARPLHFSSCSRSIQSWASSGTSAPTPPSTSSSFGGVSTEPPSSPARATVSARWHGASAAEERSPSTRLPSRR